MNSIGYRKEIGKPLDEEPVQPDNRPLVLIEALHEFNQREFIDLCPNIVDFSGQIEDGEILVDLGCGKGRFCCDFKVLRQKVKVIGVSAHKVNELYEESMDRIFYGILPDNTEFLKKFEKRVKLIVETYGPTSFADNPVHVLIYCALLLKKDGFFSSISSTTKTEPCVSVLGDITTQIKVKKFFLHYFGIKLSIIPTTIKSRVTDEAYYTDFIIRFRNTSHDLGFDDFERLCRNADQEIGIPKQGEIWYQPANTSFSIKEKIY